MCKQSRFPEILAALLVLALSLSATGWLWKVDHDNVMQQLQIKFDSRIQDFENRIHQKLLTYEQVLLGTQGLFAVEKTVTRQQFHDYIARQQLDFRYPGIQGIVFSQLVPATDRARHIAAIRKEGFSKYTIWPEGERDLYSAAIFLEPFTGRNERAFGFDNLTEPVRRTAMEQARDTGKTVVSGKVPLIHDRDGNPQAGFRMYRPVYRQKDSLDTVEQRRGNLLGWLYVPFRANDFMDDSLGDRKGRLDIEIYDGDGSSVEMLIYDSDHSTSHLSGRINALFNEVRTLDVYGHRWTMKVHSLPNFDERVETDSRQDIILNAGAAFSLLSSLFVWLLLGSRARARRDAGLIRHELAVRKQAEAGLQLSAIAIQTVAEAVLVTDINNNIVSVNPAFTEITGYAPEDVIGKNPRILSSSRHDREFYRAMWEQLLASGSWHGEIWDRRKNGEPYIKWLSIRTLRGEDGNIVNYVATFSDISKRKYEEERMRYLAHYDALTDLPNRTLFADRFSQALAQAKRSEKSLALMFIDLDKFKPVNDTLGHAVGDALLKEVAERMGSCVRESDTVSRAGGDEFVVLLTSVENDADVSLVAEKIRRALNQPFSISGHQLEISSSIGVALYPEHGENDKILTERADIAMYHAKKSGRNNVVLYHPGLTAKS